MGLRTLKLITLIALVTGALAAETGAQVFSIGGPLPEKTTSPCPLMISTFSYIAPTIDKKPVSEVKVTLTDNKAEKTWNGISKDGSVLFDSIPDGSYQATLTRDGYRKTIWMLNTECATANQGVVTRPIPVWVGDSSGIVDYAQPLLKEVESVGKFPDDKPKDTPKFTLAHPSPQGVTDGVRILARPKYPPTAKAVGATGAVQVQVLIDEDGYVVSAKAISGHPLLKSVAAEAARASRFNPTLLEGKPVKVSGIIVFNFQ